MVLGVLLIALISGSSMVGCTPGGFTVELPPADALFIICDNTGESPSDTCTSGFLQRVGASWSEQYKTMPESRLQVVCSADRYANTREQLPIVVPSSWHGNPRYARQTWQKQDVVEALGQIDVPHDTPDNWTVNKSDLVSAVALSSVLAGEWPEHHRHLLISSDGLWIGYGFNLEKEFPSLEDVISRLEEEGMDWDLSMFEEVQLCGFHNRALTAGEAQARRAFWSGLLEAGCGPKPTIYSSCVDLFLDAPEHLLLAEG